MRLIHEPTVTLVSSPQFYEPGHLPVEWLEPGTDGENLVEYAGRLCYMSQRNPAERTNKEYLANVRSQGHGSVFEHASYSLLLEGISRSCSHEFVRHRAGFAYSQLSQRYVDMSSMGFVVPPAYLDLESEALAQGHSQIYQYFAKMCALEAEAYVQLVTQHEAALDVRGVPKPKRKVVREAGRSVLGNAAETKVLATANVRAWRTAMELRSSEHADREIRRLAIAIIKLFQGITRGFFDDFELYQDADGVWAARCANHKV